MIYYPAKFIPATGEPWTFTVTVPERPHKNSRRGLDKRQRRGARRRADRRRKVEVVRLTATHDVSHVFRAEVPPEIEARVGRRLREYLTEIEAAAFKIAPARLMSPEQAPTASSVRLLNGWPP